MQALLMVLSIFVASEPEGSPRARYEALVKEFDAAYSAAVAAVTRAANDQERMEASLKRPQPQDFASRFFALAERHPEDPAALDALTWVAANCLYGAPAEKALSIIARDHSRSERLKDYCGENARYGEPFWPYEELLRAVLKENPHREVKARACVALAAYLKMARQSTEKHLLGDSRQMPRPPASLANFDRIRDRGLDKVEAEAAALFEEVLARYSDVEIDRSYPRNAGEFARGQLLELRSLALGVKAPEIEGRDIRGSAVKLSDYRGKVVVLDFGSHRSCGVCRQMYPHLRDFVRDYQGKPVALIGISVEDDVKELVSLAEKGETTWPIWWDGENLEGPLAARWVIRTMPTFYVLDHRGVIRNKGFLQPDQIRSTVDKLLSEMPGTMP